MGGVGIVRDTTIHQFMSVFVGKSGCYCKLCICNLSNKLSRRMPRGASRTRNTH